MGGFERIFCVLLAKIAKKEEIKSGLEMLLKQGFGFCCLCLMFFYVRMIIKQIGLDRGIQLNYSNKYTIKLELYVF